MSTRDTILDVAERLIQQRGYNGFSYADIADALDIKTASVHYHFRGKAVLAEAVARRYIDGVFSDLDVLAAEESDGPTRIDRYLDSYRALLRGEKMCLCLMLATELLTLPEGVAGEVRRFVEGSVAFLTEAFALNAPPARARRDALALFAAIEGALVMGRALDRTDVFDDVVGAFV